MSHALLSPSFANIGYKCAAATQRAFIANQRRAMLAKFGAAYHGLHDSDSQKRIGSFFEKDEDAAKLGTLMHEVMDATSTAVDKGEIDAEFIPKFVKDKCDELGATSEMEGESEFLTSTLSRRLNDMCEEIHGRENKFEVKLFVNGLYTGGTVDVLSSSPNDRILKIKDLKTGRIEVDAEDNDQLMTYAVGAVDTFDMWDKVDTIELEIIGIRFDNSKFSFDIVDLKAYKFDIIIPAYLAAYEINPLATAGNHCVYCPAKIHCAEWAQKFEMEAVTHFTSNGFENLKTPALEKLFAMCYQAEKLLKTDIKPELSFRFEGLDTPKSVKKKESSRRYWVDKETLMIDKLSGMISVEEITTPKLKSIDEILAMVKDDTDKLTKVKELIVKRNISPSFTPIK